jgi:hypothetical protein
MACHNNTYDYPLYLSIFYPLYLLYFHDLIGSVFQFLAKNFTTEIVFIYFYFLFLILLIFLQSSVLNFSQASILLYRFT